MTQFRALPVRQGDAYLLKSGRGTYLVDGGMLSGFLPEMLRERQAGKLRAVVCTFACPERLGGIIDLMDSRYPVGEYWLPDSLRLAAGAAARFNGDWSAWFVLCGHPVPATPLPLLRTGLTDASEARLSGCAMLALLACSWCFGGLPVRTASLLTPSEAIGAVTEMLVERSAKRWKRPLSAVLRDVAMRFMSGGGVEDLALFCGQLLFREGDIMKVKLRNGYRTVARGLAMALMVEALRVREGFRVRYFRPTGRREDLLVPRHPFRCLNGVEAAAPRRRRAPASAGAMFAAASALSCSGEGLVFEYGDVHCGALFCSNTRMAFLERDAPIAVLRPTVITAPQRGGVGEEEAYGRIVSTNPLADVWVRAHFSYARKVSEAFKEQPVRSCLNNCAHRVVQEVLLSFSGGRWKRLAGGKCDCLAVP